VGGGVLGLGGTGAGGGGLTAGGSGRSKACTTCWLFCKVCRASPLWMAHSNKPWRTKTNTKPQTRGRRRARA